MSSRPSSYILRRFGAICYDSLLLVAVLFAAGLPLPLIPESLRFVAWVRYATFCYLVLVSFAFFGWFWIHGGQTLGMRAWHLRLVADGGRTVTWKLALRRFAWSIISWAALGLGFLWSLVDPQRLAWHDRLSGTRLVRVPSRSQLAQQEETDHQKHHGR
ncbi:MAG: RDD family protein [Arenicellales bacterium]